MRTEKESMLGRVAWLYYDQGMNQQEIADFVGVSRLTINRSLKEARDKGIVEFRIHEKHVRCFEIEETLRRRTGLDMVTVVPAASDVFSCVGAGAIPRFKRALSSCKTIALGGGRTILSMAKRLPKTRKATTEQVVSMGEFTGSESVYSTDTIAHFMTTKLSVKCHQIESLGISTPLEVVNAFMGTPPVAKAIEMALNADIAFVSPCDVATSEMIFYSPISESLRTELLNMGVVGGIEGTMYTLDGRPHETVFSRRECVRFPMKCPVVMVAGGLNKVNSILGAIRGGFINELITDNKVAARLLDYF